MVEDDDEISDADEENDDKLEKSNVSTTAEAEVKENGAEPPTKKRAVEDENGKPLEDDTAAATTEVLPGTPNKVTGTPQKDDGTPQKDDGAPQKADGTPLKADGTPLKADGTPLKVTSEAKVDEPQAVKEGVEEERAPAVVEATEATTEAI